MSGIKQADKVTAIKLDIYNKFLVLLWEHGAEAIEVGCSLENPMYLVREICDFLEEQHANEGVDIDLH